MNYHRTYFEPLHSVTVRETQWIPPRRKGHRETIDLKPAKKALHHDQP